MSKVSGEQYRNIRLCIDTYEHGEAAGRYYHPAVEGGGGSFHSLTQFFVDMENLLDKTGYPQSYTEKRIFFLPTEHPAESVSVLEQRKGKTATFIIRVLFRQHASWQGSVTWVEHKGEQSFRSVLDLIILLDSALSGCGEG